MEGLTNFNYYMHDTGVLSILGVKQLDYLESTPIYLFNKKYLPYQKQSFLSAFSQLVWFTYRNNFPGLLNRKNFLKIKDFEKDTEMHKDRKIYRSDTGWGCMIRVAQMIMARALFLITEAKVSTKVNEDYFARSDDTTLESICDVQAELEKEIEKKRKTIKPFLDCFWDSEAPFGIQNFVEFGYEMQKKLPGDWYGANAAALVLEKLNNTFLPNKYLRVAVFNDHGIKVQQ